MEVNCEFLNARTTDTTKDIAGRTINAGAAGNFRWKVQQQLTNGDTVLLDDDMEMLVIGGRHSICQAFGENPVAHYVFSAPPGKVIYASHAASSRKRWAVAAGTTRAVQILSGPGYNLMQATAAGCRDLSPRSFAGTYASSMRQTYNPQINRSVGGVLRQAAKTRTVLHLFSESANFGGNALGPHLNGAALSLVLARFFA